MSIFTRAAAGCATMVLALSAPANAGCWVDHERESAGVRELQTMLMVASLRCQARGIDILADYNGFVQASRTTLEAVNLDLKMHFAGAGGGQDDYDRFTTQLANAYGDGETDAAACAEAAATARDAAASPAQLRRMAALRIFPRALPGGFCEAPAGTAPVLAAVAAPPPPARVVTLPDEVVAAMAVMARYNAAPTATPAAAPAPTQLATAH